MATQSILLKYLDLLREEGLNSLTKRSTAWFIDMLSSGELRGTAGKVMKDAVAIVRDRPIIGKMYMFVYDPKYKATLPYWDRYPLIIAADRPLKGKGFFGLNLHYLSPMDRAKLMHALMPLSTTGQELKTTTKLRITYGVLKAAMKYRLFRPAFKRYLPNQIKSNIIEIPSEFWEVAMFLPTQKFNGATVSEVWAASRKKARKV